MQKLLRKLPPGSSSDGVAQLFVTGSTAALATIEFEPGAVADLLRALEQIAPIDCEYEHNKAWATVMGMPIFELLF